MLHNIDRVQRDNHGIWNALIAGLTGFRWYRVVPNEGDEVPVYLLTTRGTIPDSDESMIPVSVFEAWANRPFWHLPDFSPMTNINDSLQVVQALTEGLPYPETFRLCYLSDENVWAAAFWLDGQRQVAERGRTPAEAITFAAIATFGYSVPQH